jgi:hypothetical protein
MARLIEKIDMLANSPAFFSVFVLLVFAAGGTVAALMVFTR